MINLILSDTERSLNYIQMIFKNNINVNKIIFYSNKKKGLIYNFIKQKKINNLLIYCKTKNINSSIINKKLKLYKSKLNIISTYPGEIVENPKLLKKKLLHSHPGDLPIFKGSTTIYYTILLKQKICVTLFFMNKEIDAGKIVYKKYFNYPKNLNEIEKNFDNKIRALTLIEYLKSTKNYKFKKTRRNFLPYYIAHPIIRQIVINKKLIIKKPPEISF